MQESGEVATGSAAEDSGEGQQAALAANDPANWEAEWLELEREKMHERWEERVVLRSAKKQPVPLFEPDAVQRLQQFTARLLESFAKTACGGLRENILACTAEVQASCHERDAGACPKNAMAYERKMAALCKPNSMSLSRSLSSIGVPHLIADKLESEKFDRTEAIKAVEDWFAQKPRKHLLVLRGGTGVGKSFGAAYLLGRHTGGRFVTATEIVNRKNEDGFIHSLRIPTILVVDDLGAEAQDGFGSSAGTLSQVICERCDTGTMLVITTNLRPAEIGARYGERVFDRLRGFGKTVGLGGESLR